MKQQHIKFNAILQKFKYRTFSKYGPGVNYFQMASDQVLNSTRRSIEIEKHGYINRKQCAWYQAFIWTWALFWKFTVNRRIRSIPKCF